LTGNTAARILAPGDGAVKATARSVPDQASNMKTPNEIEANGSDPSSAGTPRSLLDCVHANESRGWERLVALYAPLVFHWCRQHGLQDSDAADVAQEVFRAVLTHFGTFRKEKKGDTFRGWLRTIFRNKVNDLFRQRAREPAGAGGSDAQTFLSQQPGPSAPEEVALADGPAERDLLNRALALLRGEFEERTWQAFWQTTVESRETGDVAADLGMSSGAVRVAKCRVLHRLREFLGDLPQ
jgi:RNA polymerase sigma-70 factor, ECF subfamily